MAQTLGKGHLKKTLLVLNILLLAYLSYSGFPTTVASLFVLTSFFYTIYSPIIGVFLVGSALTLNGVQLFSAATPFLLWVMLAFSIGYVSRALIAVRLNALKINAVEMTVIVTLLLTTFLGLFLSQNYGRLPHWVAFCIGLFSSAFLIKVFASQKVSAYWFFIYFSISSLVIILLPMVADGIAFSGRLTANENVRAAANATGFFIVYFLTYIFFQSKKIQAREFLVLCLLIGLGVTVLLLTASRGVFLSIMAALTVGILMAFAGSILRGRVKLSTITVLTSPVMLIGASIIFQYHGSLMLARLDRVEQGLDIRISFWLAAIDQMSFMSYLIGNGVATFRDLANLGGFDYYAHSVFVDTFVSSGFIGLSVLLTLIFSLFVFSMRQEKYQTVSMLVFIVVAFSTHGALNSFPFLIYFSIIIFTFLNEGMPNARCGKSGNQRTAARRRSANSKPLQKDCVPDGCAKK